MVKEFIENGESEAWDDFVMSPLVTDTLSWLGVPFRGELDWEYGLSNVLTEMTDEGLLMLWDRRLQIEIRDHDCRMVWAYFPMYQHKWLAEYVQIQPYTQVLLEISATKVEDCPLAPFEKKLRHQIGHVLRFLRHPTWTNHCYQASREWRKSCK